MNNLAEFLIYLFHIKDLSKSLIYKDGYTIELNMF